METSLPTPMTARVYVNLPEGTWWLIPLSKWAITPVISGLTLLIPFITGVITHLLSGMSHQVYSNDITGIPQFLAGHQLGGHLENIPEASGAKHSGLVAVRTFRVRFEAGDAGVSGVAVYGVYICI